MIFILISVFASGQNELSGIVKDQNNSILAGATVFLPEIQKGTVTNDHGTYRLTGLPAGKFKVQFSFVGYKTHIETIQSSGYPLYLEISLDLAVIDAEEIVISGGYHSSQHENAVKIELLKINPITLTNTPNFTEMLSRVPGLDMISKGSGVSKPVIRGLSMDDILVLNNNVRLENYQYSQHHPLGIDEFGIGNVEIIKGPASLLYGSDAIGGVINFIRENPAPTGTITGDYHLQLFSNSLGFQNNLGIKGTEGNYFWGIRAGQKSHSDYLQGGGEFLPNTRFNGGSIKLMTGYTAKRGTFRLFYDYNDQKQGLAEEDAIEEITERGRKSEIWYQHFRNHMVSSQNRLYLDHARVDLDAAYQQTDLAHFTGKDTIGIEMRLSTVTYEARLSLTPRENTEVIFGAQGLNQENRNLNTREEILLPDAITYNYAGMLLLQHHFAGKIMAQAGLRYDHKWISTQAVGEQDDPEYRPSLDKDYGSFSGSIGATWNISEELLFRGNFAAAYRTPNLAELTSNGLHELRYELGNPDLAPQHAYEADLSMHYHSDHITFDLAGFHNRIRNYIILSPTPDSTVAGDRIYRFSQADAALFGGEAGIHIHPQPVEWLHLETTLSTVTGKKDNGEYLPFIPSGKWRLEVMADRKSLGFMKDVYVKISSQVAFDQNRPAPDEANTGGYALFDMGVGGQVQAARQRISIGFSINNILDRKYADHLSTLKEVNGFNPGRNFTLYLMVRLFSKRYA